MIWLKNFSQYEKSQDQKSQARVGISFYKKRFLKLEYFYFNARLDFLPEKKRESWGDFQDQLWEKTCFEFFCRTERTLTEYCEWNVAASGDWACYLFSDYRKKERNLSSKDEAGLCDFFFDSEKSYLRFLINLELFPELLGKITKENSFWGQICQIQSFQGQKEYFALDHGLRLDFHDFQTWKKIQLEMAEE